MKIQKKTVVKCEIPQASLPDIIFLLLIFFMVTTVVKKFQGLPVRLPEAEKIEKIEGQRHLAYIWVAQEGRISIDDQLVRAAEVATVMYDRRVADPQVIVSLKIDREAEMGMVAEIQEGLRKADALRVNYSTNLKSN